MRRPPKPFVVEVKRGKKANGFGILGDTEALLAEASRPSSVGARAARLDAERAFAPQRPVEAAKRILPDLTPAVEPPPAAAPAPVEIEAPLPKLAAPKRQPKRPATPPPAAAPDEPIVLAWPDEKPAKPSLPKPAVLQARPIVVETAATKPPRTRRSRRDDLVVLPRGERWKRRLPSVLR